jgi:hypothetical protein
MTVLRQFCMMQCQILEGRDPKSSLLKNIIAILFNLHLRFSKQVVSNMAPATAKALVTRVDGDKSTMDIKSMPVPKIEPHQLLVRVGSVAQNPTDGKNIP